MNLFQRMQKISSINTHEEIIQFVTGCTTLQEIYVFRMVYGSGIDQSQHTVCSLPPPVFCPDYGFRSENIESWITQCLTLEYFMFLHYPVSLCTCCQVFMRYIALKLELLLFYGSYCNNLLIAKVYT